MKKEVRELILSVIGKSEVSMIGSVDSEGYPNMKAMLKPRENDGLKTFYFTTNTSSLRVNQFRSNGRASLYFSDNKSFKGVMLKGHVQVLTDQETKNRIWREGDDLYYSKGITDPDYCVLRFMTESIRLYENFKSEDFKL